MTTPFLMPLGKWKGRPITEIDSGYLHWLTDKLDEWHPPLRAAIEAERERRKSLSSSAGGEAETRRTQRSVPEQRAACGICGQRETDAEPLVHARCARDEVRF